MPERTPFSPDEIDSLARGDGFRWQEVIHPDLRPLLKRVPHLTFGPWTSAALRLLTQSIHRVVPAPKEASLEVVWQGRQQLRVFRPQDRPKLPAALLWLHGGGRLIGHPVTDDRRSAWLAQQLGIVVVAASYRLAPREPFPAALDDCAAAWRWVQDHAGELGVDPGRVAVGGESAGGGLAAELTHRLRDEGGVQPRGQVLVYPMLDDRTAADRSLDALRHLVWNNESNRYGWASYLGCEPGAEDIPAHASASRRADLSGLPPAWLTVGDLDLFYREDLRYAERLREAGVAAEVAVVAGGFHGFFAGERGEAVLQPVLESLLRFLGEQLG